MKIVQDSLDGEVFIDLLLTPLECEGIKSFSLISCDVEIEGKSFSIGLKLDNEIDEDIWQETIWI